MTLTLACKDLGISSCPYVARGKTEDEVMEKGAKHGKDVHGYTDKQLNDPKMMKQVKAAIKKE
jgi:predicted small metal-binding protein